jgi:hypothetical protein
MRRLDRSAVPAWLRALACVALAVLALGSAAHVWHHLGDPSCENERGGLHPCTACSSLHAAAELTDAGVSSPRLPEAADSRVFMAVASVTTRRPAAECPRAPPAS